MAVKTEEAIKSGPDSIEDVVKIHPDVTELDQTKTEGRRMRGLLNDIWDSLKKLISDNTQALTGKADLDVTTGKLLASQIPDSLLGAVEYQGTYNAATNTPALAVAAAGNKGQYYVVGVAGTSSVNGLEYAVGDWIISDGTQWDKLDNTTTQLVTSVNTKTGAVILVSEDINYTAATPSNWGGVATRTIKAALDYIATTYGKVKTVNGSAPDANGNVTVAAGGMDFSTFTELATGEVDTDILAVQRTGGAKVKWSLARLKTYLYGTLGFVKTINNNGPDANGNVNVSAGGAAVTNADNLDYTPADNTFFGVATGVLVKVKAALDKLVSDKLDKSAVKQVTGNSQTEIMSQKAVTDMFNNYTGTQSQDAKWYRAKTVTAAGGGLWYPGNMNFGQCYIINGFLFVAGTHNLYVFNEQTLEFLANLGYGGQNTTKAFLYDDIANNEILNFNGYRIYAYNRDTLATKRQVNIAPSIDTGTIQGVGWLDKDRVIVNSNGTIIIHNVTTNTQVSSFATGYNTNRGGVLSPNKDFFVMHTNESSTYTVYDIAANTTFNVSSATPAIGYGKGAIIFASAYNFMALGQFGLYNFTINPTTKALTATQVNNNGAYFGNVYASNATQLGNNSLVMFCVTLYGYSCIVTANTVTHRIEGLTPLPNNQTANYLDSYAYSPYHKGVIIATNNIQPSLYKPLNFDF